MSERNGETRVEDDALQALRLIRESRQASKGDDADQELDAVQANLEWEADDRARKARKRAIHNAEVDIQVQVQGMTVAEQIAWAKAPELAGAVLRHLKPEAQIAMIEESEKAIIARAESRRERELAAKKPKKSPESWLAEQLCDGRQIKAVLLIELAKNAGYRKRTLDRAKEKLGAMSRRIGFGPRAVWYWYLPKSNRSRRKTP